MSEQGAKLVKLKFNFVDFCQEWHPRETKKPTTFFWLANLFSKVSNVFDIAKVRFIVVFFHLIMLVSHGFWIFFSGFLKSFENLITSIENWLFVACVVSVQMLLVFLKIYTSDFSPFFRVANLQELMQHNCLIKFILG